MAGDLIDEEVIRMIRSRADRVRSGTLQDLQRRKRSIKETLFSRTRKVFEAGVEITLSDLEKQERILQMRDALAVSFRDLVEDASAFIATFVQASFHRADQINVVFAGGGSNIGFLHQAVGQSVKLSNGRSVPVVIRTATKVARPMPAAVERLAVAMGGTTPDRYWPITLLAGAGRETSSKPIEGRYPDWWRGLE